MLVQERRILGYLVADKMADTLVQFLWRYRSISDAGCNYRWNRPIWLYLLTSCCSCRVRYISWWPDRRWQHQLHHPAAAFPSAGVWAASYATETEQNHKNLRDYVHMLWHGSVIFIQTDTHARIHAHPSPIKLLAHKNRWNRWFLYQKCMDLRSDSEPTSMHQLHVLLTLSVLLLWIRYIKIPNMKIIWTHPQSNMAICCLQ